MSKWSPYRTPLIRACGGGGAQLMGFAELAICRQRYFEAACDHLAEEHTSSAEQLSAHHGLLSSGRAPSAALGFGVATAPGPPVFGKQRPQYLLTVSCCSGARKARPVLSVGFRFGAFSQWQWLRSTRRPWGR